MSGAALASSPSVTVVICTCGRPDALTACLESICAQDFPHFNILVVDNTPGDARTRAVAGNFEAKYVVEPVPGLARARNAGARASASDLVAYIDDDAVACPGWISALVREFSDPKTALVTGRILPLNASEESTRLWVSIGGAHGGGTLREIYDLSTERWFRLVHFVGIGHGANMALRTNLFDTWSGFNERLGRGTAIGTGEEAFAFFELIRDGWKVVYTPQAVVRHPYPDTPEQARKLQLKAFPRTGAYVAMLLAEVPEFRPETLAYVKSKLGRGRTLPQQLATESRLVSRWRSVGGMAKGAISYLRTRVKQS